MKMVGGDVINMKVILAFPNMVLDIGTFIIKTIDILFIPIEIRNKHRIGIPQNIKKIRLRPIHFILPPDDHHSSVLGPGIPSELKTENLDLSYLSI